MKSPQKASQRQFSPNIVQIININTPPKNIAEETLHYYDLMAKLDQIIAESRKTQQMIREKQAKSPIIVRGNNMIEKIRGVLESTEIPESDSESKIAIRRIFQRRIFESRTEIESPVGKKMVGKVDDEFEEDQEQKLRMKIEKVREISGFDMMGFIDELYELALTKTKPMIDDPSPIKKSKLPIELHSQKPPDFSDVQIPLEEDLSWKKISKEFCPLFYGETLPENIEPNYSYLQSMETQYTRILDVYFTGKI